MTDDFRSWVLKSREQGHLSTLAQLLDSTWGNFGTAPTDPTTASIALGEQLTIRRCVNFIQDPIPKPKSTLPAPTYGVDHQ